MVKYVKDAVLKVVTKKATFLDVTQRSLVKHISATAIQCNVVSLHFMKSYGGVKIQPQSFLALHGGELSASRSGRFIPGERKVG
jgi:hypothetical protein